MLYVSLSECDVGASKAVVNGLAPGSNGQDKGKHLQEAQLAIMKQFYTARSVWGLGRSQYEQ